MKEVIIIIIGRIHITSPSIVLARRVERNANRARRVGAADNYYYFIYIQLFEIYTKSQPLKIVTATQIT